MRYSAQQLAELARLEGRLETSDVKRASRSLLDWAERRKGIFVLPIPRGAFSAVHLAIQPDARPHADCPFAFKGAKAHLRWWFRKPCFDAGLCGRDSVLKEFADAQILKSGEIAINLDNPASVEGLCHFLEMRL